MSGSVFYIGVMLPPETAGAWVTLTPNEGNGRIIGNYMMVDDLYKPWMWNFRVVLLALLEAENEY